MRYLRRSVVWPICRRVTRWLWTTYRTRPLSWSGLLTIMQSRELRKCKSRKQLHTISWTQTLFSRRRLTVSVGSLDLVSLCRRSSCKTWWMHSRQLRHPQQIKSWGTSTSGRHMDQMLLSLRWSACSKLFRLKTSERREYWTRCTSSWPYLSL